MPVTGCKRTREVSQRDQYAKGGVGRWYWDFRDREARQYVRGARILDAGCGEGITLEKLVHSLTASHVEGIDIDPVNVGICQSRGLSVCVGSLYDLPYPEAVFDGCLLMEVIEHLDKPERALEELRRVMRPGGRIVIVYPVDWVMFAARIMCLRFREAMFDPGHVRQWNRSLLRRQFSQTGFRLVAAKAIPFCPPLMLHGIVIGERVD